MAKKKIKKITSVSEGPLHRQWRQDVEAQIEQALEILHHRRAKDRMHQKALAVKLKIRKGQITETVADMRLAFLVDHQWELYKSSEYTGLDLEDLILDAVRQYMVNLQQTVQKNPFLGSPLHQKHLIAKKAELYNHRVATDSQQPDYTS